MIEILNPEQLKDRITGYAFSKKNKLCYQYINRVLSKSNLQFLQASNNFKYYLESDLNEYFEYQILSKKLRMKYEK